MLYERWRQTVRESPGEIALRDLPSARRWTFAELDRAALASESGEAIAFTTGQGPEFVFSVLRAWKHGQVTCPLEVNRPAPTFPALPPSIVHLKITSATTGLPKLVAFTAEQLAADAENIVATMNLRRDWPNLGVISLAHSYGFSNLITPLLLHGIPLILAGPPFPEMIRAAGELFPAVTVPAVPALWRAWSEAGTIPQSTRLAISAGAPLPVSLEKEIFARCGLKVHNFYGASECGGIAYDARTTPRDDLTYVGAPMKNVVLSLNGDGCLEVRGRNVAETYWPEPAAALADGMFTTSDLAGLTTIGVFLRGRVNDIINVAGRKISPEAVEQVLAAHPAVSDCLVFGAASGGESRGDAIVACVVRRHDVSAEELRQFVLTRSPAWQAPREFWFVDSLEVNERGKLSRAEWRARFLSRRKGVRPGTLSP